MKINLLIRENRLSVQKVSFVCLKKDLESTTHDVREKSYLNLEYLSTNFHYSRERFKKDNKFTLEKIQLGLILRLRNLLVSGLSREYVIGLGYVERLNYLLPSCC